MEDVVYSQDDDKIIIDGAYNSYIIKLGTGNEGKEKILYECYYTDILNSDNGDFTCYINDFFSVCVVDNKSNEIILNKYIEVHKYLEDNVVNYFDKEVNEDVVLYVKYFTGEKAEIARVKGESIYFYIFDNELEFFCRENDDVEGTYNLVGNV